MPAPAAPAAGTLAGELYADQLAPYTREDEANGYALGVFLIVLLSMAQDIADLVRDDPDSDAPGWSALVDADRAPAWALPWLAQLAGVVLRANLSEAAQRLAIKELAGQKRGRLRSGAAARQYLIGPDGSPDTATVYVFERYGSAYRMRIATLEAETPDPAAVLAALEAEKAGGIILDYDVIAAGGDWDALASTHATWAEVLTDFTDWADVLADPTQT
jgi:hypothetical protein